MQPIKINLAGTQFRQDPIEKFGELRHLGPLIRVKIPVIGKVWMATTFDACVEVLRDTKRFVREPKNAGRSMWLYGFFALMMPGLFRALSQNMIAMDEPDHRRLRSLVEKAFVRRNVAEMRDDLVHLAASMMAPMERNEGTVDLVASYARPYPLAVICELLGLPDEDRPQFSQWFRPFAELSSMWQIFRVVPGLRKTKKYLLNQFQERREHPKPGLISELVQAEEKGDRLSEDELLSMVFLLLLAGHETTVHLLTNTVLCMTQFPEHKHRLLECSEFRSQFVDEVLRYCSVVQFAKPRFAATDMEFFGQPVKRGELVMPCTAAANYDPDAFEQPEQFLPERKNNSQHLTFGSGPHICLGMKLAKAETEITIQQLLSRYPNFQPAFDVQNPDWSKRLGFRSLASLNLELQSNSSNAC